jgi:hypothetical protein
VWAFVTDVEPHTREFHILWVFVALGNFAIYCAVGTLMEMVRAVE